MLMLRYDSNGGPSLWSFRRGLDASRISKWTLFKFLPQFFRKSFQLALEYTIMMNDVHKFSYFDSRSANISSTLEKVFTFPSAKFFSPCSKIFLRYGVGLYCSVEKLISCFSTKSYISLFSTAEKGIPIFWAVFVRPPSTSCRS